MSNKKRVTIFMNYPDDNHLHGKVFAVPESIDKLIENVQNKFQLLSTSNGQASDQESTPTAIIFYTANGGQIDDVDLIRDDEILYAYYNSKTKRKVNEEKEAEHVKVSASQSDDCIDCDVAKNTPIINQKQQQQSRSDRTACSSPSNGEWIKLNIGGKLFTTTRSTIVAKEPSSMLAKMFEISSTTNSGPTKTTKVNNNNQDLVIKRNCDQSSSSSCIVPSLMDDQGAYMIDRSPEYFQPLIGYLRHGQLIIDKHLNPMGVLEEAKFYGFYSLIPELEATILQESLLQNTIERSIGLAPLTRRDVLKAIIHTGTDTQLRFQGANLSGADLSRLDLSNINFKYAILRGANLQGATLNNCCMERADMSKCNLEGASMINCHMVCCNLEGSILRGSNMDSDTLQDLTNLEGANLNNVNLEGSKMKHVNLRVASLKNANVQNCNLDYACLAGANLENCDLSGSDLNEVNLRGANLKGTRFDLIHTPLHMYYVTS